VKWKKNESFRVGADINNLFDLFSNVIDDFSQLISVSFGFPCV